MCEGVHMGKSEDSLRERLLSLHYVILDSLGSLAWSQASLSSEPS